MKRKMAFVVGRIAALLIFVSVFYFFWRDHYTFWLVILYISFTSLVTGSAITILQLVKNPEVYNDPALGFELSHKLSDKEVLTKAAYKIVYFNLQSKQSGRKVDSWNIKAFEVYGDLLEQGETHDKAWRRAFEIWCQEQGIDNPSANDRKNFKKNMKRAFRRAEKMLEDPETN